MNNTIAQSIPDLPGLPRRQPAVANGVLGMIIFVVTEIMFFTALVSAFLVIRASSGDKFIPPETIRLPIAVTGVNTLILLASGFILFGIRNRLSYRTPTQGQTWGVPEQLFGLGTLLAATFVAVQGYEWVQLLNYGMSMTSGIFGACFFLLIGCHGLHAVAGILGMLVLLRKLGAGRLTKTDYSALLIYWSFVVLVWPVLYTLVYF